MFVQRINKSIGARVLLCLVVATATVSLAACGGSSTSGDSSGKLSGTSLTIGSKDFTENKILSYITKLALEEEGASVEDRTGISSSVNTRKALLAGEIDMYWEYTGTAWNVYLKKTEPLDDPQEQYEAVAKLDLKENNIEWLPRAPLNNTYALAASTETAEDLGVSKMSDLTKLYEENPEAVTICVETEFKGRDDGLSGMLDAHDLQDLPSSNIKTVGTAIIYTEVDKGELCNFGEVYTTDARIESLDLVVLEDDRRFFPVYNAAPTLRAETLKKHPEIKDILEPIASKLDDDTMRNLNAQADIEGREPEDVAEDWLQEEGFVS